MHAVNLKLVLDEAVETGCECSTCELIRALVTTGELLTDDPERISKNDPYAAAKWAAMWIVAAIVVTGLLCTYLVLTFNQ